MIAYPFVAAMMLAGPPADPVPMFVRGPDSRELPPARSDARYPAIKREYPVVLDVRGLASFSVRGRERLVVALPGSRSTVVTLKRFTPTLGFVINSREELVPDPGVPDEKLHFSWYGVGKGVELWLSHREGHVLGRLTIENTVYTFDRLRGHAVMQELDLSQVPAEHTDVYPPDSTMPAPKYADAQLAKTIHFVQVLFVHTPEAVQATGRPDNLTTPDVNEFEPGTVDKVHTLLIDSVAHLNTIFANSGVASVVENVLPNGQASVETTAYVGEQNNCFDTTPCTVFDHFSFHRRWARANLGGLRDQHGADLVVLVVGDGTSCGIAYTQRNNCHLPAKETDVRCTIGDEYTAFAYAAVSAETDKCPVTSYTIALEMGHQYGMEHQPDPANQSGASLPGSYGLRRHAVSNPPGARTVMANNCFVDTDLDGTPDTERCPLYMHFSNPMINFGPEPTVATGTLAADEFGRFSFNARTAAAIGPQISDFRRSEGAGRRLGASSFEDLPDIYLRPCFFMAPPDQCSSAPE